MTLYRQGDLWDMLFRTGLATQVYFQHWLAVANHKVISFSIFERRCLSFISTYPDITWLHQELWSSVLQPLSASSNLLMYFVKPVIKNAYCHLYNPAVDGGNYQQSAICDCLRVMYSRHILPLLNLTSPLKKCPVWVVEGCSLTKHQCCT